MRNIDIVSAAPASAELDHTMTSIAIPDQPNAIEIGTAPLPGATAPEAWHSQYGSQFARNVTVATITPFLPDPSGASGAAAVDGERRLGCRPRSGQVRRRGIRP